MIQDPSGTSDLTASPSGTSRDDRADREALPPQGNHPTWLRSSPILRVLAVWMLCEIASFLVLGIFLRSKEALHTATLVLGTSLGTLVVLSLRRTPTPRHD